MIWGDFGLTSDMRTGIAIGAVIGAILGGLYQQHVAASRLERQVKDGYFLCHSQLHADEDVAVWMNEPKELYIQHEVVDCGWVGDNFQATTD